LKIVLAKKQTVFLVDISSYIYVYIYICIFNFCNPNSKPLGR
jgi:hypothetical protein